jgi:exopolyphosphatase/pppGpp-phosphohydrolase
MSTHNQTTYAAIDLGSNISKLSILRSSDENIEVIANESTMTRIGEAVNATGQITPEKQAAVISTLQKYQQLAQQHEAASLIVVATAAVRKAQNREAFLKAVQEQTGLTINVVSGEVEATLTFLGAISDHQEIAAPIVVDIGGGSTELLLAQQGHIQWLTSLPIGSGWLHDSHLPSDPPTSAEIGKARTLLTRYLLQLQLPAIPPAEQAHRSLIATGSSAKSLLSLAKQALKVDQANSLLKRNDLLGCMGLLSALPAEDIARRYEQPVERARVLPGGALILLSLLDFLQQEEFFVSQRGVSEGAVLAMLRYGHDWIEHPDIKGDSARASKAPMISDQDESDKPSKQKSQKDDSPQLTFAQTGQQELQKRSKKFLTWINPVLQNEDVEAVHDMRVASRRLRATLDAYESACAKKPFQRVYGEVKQAADLLGTARDTDVMLQHLEQQQQQLPDDEIPGIQWLMSRLQSYRKQQQEEIEAFFEDFHSKRFERSVTSCIPDGVSDHGKS